MRKRVCWAILAMGFSGLVAQILLLRELLIVFSGNELCIGIVLANWLILEASGSFFLGRRAEKTRNRLETFSVVTILFSLSLFAATFLTRILKGVLGISVGESIGLVPMVYSSFLILLPVAVLHGALFTLSCQVYAMFSDREAASAGRVYAYETVGTIVGGIVCTYLFIPYLNTFQVASGLALLNGIACLVLLAPTWKIGVPQKALVVLLGALVLLSGYLLLGGQADKLHRTSIEAQWRNQKVVHYQNSPYGNICIIENQGQYIFFQDGIPSVITPIPDMSFVQEFVHIPLLAHPEPQELLILSGGAGGVIDEALKYPSIETIEYAELDPLLLELFREFPTPLTESELNDRRVQVQQTDGRLLLKTTRNTYDVILVGIMEPSNLQSNRFFTREFFSLAKTKLNEGGILVLGLPGSLTLLNEELRNLNSSIFHTLQTAFPHIRALPGDGTNLFLLSDSPEVVTIDGPQLLARLEQRGIQTDVIVPWHMERKLHHGWQDWFADFIQGGSQKINADFSPVGLFYSISHWNALFAPSLRWLFGQLERISLGTVALFFALSLLLVLFLRSRRKRPFRAAIPFAIITTGFAGMVFDLVLVFSFQAIHGVVFSWIGLLVASFMAGAACGAMLTTRALARTKDCRRLFTGIELAILGFSIGCPLVFVALHEYLGGPGGFFPGVLFLVISFVCGFLIGSQFPLANQMVLRNSPSLSRTAGLLYASDLLGGWLGGMVGAVVLLPVLGLVGTGITVGLLKATSLIVITAQPTRDLGGGGK